jgi:hypothetical protein
MQGELCVRLAKSVDKMHGASLPPLFHLRDSLLHPIIAFTFTLLLTS